MGRTSYDRVRRLGQIDRPRAFRMDLRAETIPAALFSTAISLAVGARAEDESPTAAPAAQTSSIDVAASTGASTDVSPEGGATDSGHDETEAASTESGPTSGASARLHGLVFGAKGLAPYQSREFGFGAGALAALEWGPSPYWGVQLELGFVALGGNKKAPPAGLDDLRGATGGQITAGFRVRPLAGLTKSISSLWLGAGVGASVTGGKVAPAIDAFLGYNFDVAKKFSIGPAVGYLLVLQTDKSSPRPENAHVGLFGLNGSFDFGGGAPRGPKDRDYDGILDAQDACPDDPEDLDGFKDEDGCPEPDNDGDGLPDLVDRCPLDPEDKDDFQDEDGCSDLDNDGDKILDEADACPLEPEDYDGYLDEDGCPEPDNDGDKILDVRDLCPNEAETINGIADNDGCPDSESVRVVGDKIELDQKIHFWTNSDVIRAMSYPVLDKLATFLLDHPEYVHVDIEGHADARGSDDFNLDLSQRRARSILDFLVKRGLEESRLSSQGFGSTRPLVDAQNEGAWFMNRRVEFVVTRNREVKVVTGVPAAQDAPAFGRDKEMPEAEPTVPAPIESEDEEVEE